MTQSLKQRLSAMGISNPVALVESLAAKGKLSRKSVVDYEALERKAQEKEARRKVIRFKNGKRMKTRKSWVKSISPAEARSSVNVEAGGTTSGATRPEVES